jgi:hypothetical protein
VPQLRSSFARLRLRLSGYLRVDDSGAKVFHTLEALVGDNQRVVVVVPTVLRLQCYSSVLHSCRLCAECSTIVVHSAFKSPPYTQYLLALHGSLLQYRTNAVIQRLRRLT